MAKKRPAAQAAAPVPPAKKPAVPWAKWAAAASSSSLPQHEDMDLPPDISGINQKQRRAWGKIFATLPKQIQDAYNAAKSSNQVGHQKDINSIMNAVIPKDLVARGINVEVNSAMMSRFRTLSCARVESSEDRGCTYTEMIGTGKLGSDQALRAGLERGDVVMRVSQGRELYYMHSESDTTKVTDLQGREVRASADLSKNMELVQQLINVDAAGFGDAQWLSWSVSPEQAKELQKPPSPQALEHLEKALEATSGKLSTAKKLLMNMCKMRGTTDNAKQTAQKLQQSLKPLEEKKQQMEDMIMDSSCKYSDSTIKAALIASAADMKRAIVLEKELRALVRCKSSESSD